MEIFNINTKFILLESKLIIRLSYNDIFPIKQSIPNLLNKINGQTALIFLASLNKNEFELREDPSNELDFILNNWLIDFNSKLKQKVFNAFNKHKDHESRNLDFGSVRIINRISTLRSMELLLLGIATPKKDLRPGINDKESRLALFKLYLLLNEEVALRQNKIFQSHFKNNPSELDSIQFHLLIGITDPFLKTDLAELIQPELYKFILFEKWLKSHPHYYEMSLKYLRKLNTNTWYEYFSDVFNICRGSTETIFISTKSYPVLKKVLSYLNNRGDNNPSWSEFHNLRIKPVVEIEEGMFLILDMEFLLHKLFSSLYHEILAYSKTCDLPKFSQDYNKDFIEDMLLKNSFKMAFGESYKQLSESAIKKYKEKRTENLSIPDFYIRNGKKLFLFECKNSFISQANKTRLNPTKLLDEIKTKFYCYENNGTSKIKSKAVIQLKNFIENSIKGKYSFFDNTGKPEKLIYYPILIVTDPTMTSIGFNQILNYYFQREITEIGYDLRYSIKSFTIIHIDDFLYHQKRLKKLSKIIDRYHRYINKVEGFDSMISFSDFLTTKVFLKRPKISKKIVSHIFKDSLLPKG